MATEKARDADEKFCSDCGEAISVKAEICPKCGVKQQHPLSDFDKSSLQTATVLAAVLGLFAFMGVGHMYAGKVLKGILLLVGCWALWLLFIATVFVFFPVGFVFIPIGIAL